MLLINVIHVAEQRPINAIYQFTSDEEEEENKNQR